MNADQRAGAPQSTNTVENRAGGHAPGQHEFGERAIRLAQRLETLLQHSERHVSARAHSGGQRVESPRVEAVRRESRIVRTRER